MDTLLDKLGTKFNGTITGFARIVFKGLMLNDCACIRHDEFPDGEQGFERGLQGIGDDPIFGFMSIRLQTWAPYEIQIAFNQCPRVA